MIIKKGCSKRELNTAILIRCFSALNIFLRRTKLVMQVTIRVKSTGGLIRINNCWSNLGIIPAERRFPNICAGVNVINIELNGKGKRLLGSIIVPI